MGKNPLQCKRPRFDPWVGKIPWRRKWQPIPVLLPREFHGQRSLACKELEPTERLTHTHTHTHAFLRSRGEHPRWDTQ